MSVRLIPKYVSVVGWEVWNAYQAFLDEDDLDRLRFDVHADHLEACAVVAHRCAARAAEQVEQTRARSLAFRLAQPRQCDAQTKYRSRAMIPSLSGWLPKVKGLYEMPRCFRDLEQRPEIVRVHRCRPPVIALGLNCPGVRGLESGQRVSHRGT